jgi:tRNA(Arg) A34 adenosine deaminase TadA
MLSRRALLASMAGGLAAGVAGLFARARQSHAAVSPADAARFMARARDMRDRATASGDQPYGAVVVRDGTIVGLGPSRVVVGPDATGHAEMEAIRDAGRTLGTQDLSGCVMYSTSPPCRMCQTAAYWAGIERVWSGEAIEDQGKPGYGC